jgi:Carboxypeptidase regulatory-like domain
MKALAAAVCFACVSFFAGASIPAQRVGTQLPTRDRGPDNAGTATLRGRVFAAETGQPLRTALVQLTTASTPAATARPESVATTTDANGRFEFSMLRAGQYTVRAQKGSYIPLAWGQRLPNEPARPIDVRDGQTIDRLDFALTKGGVISGRVVDESGEPAVEVEVAAMRAPSRAGARRLLSGRTVRTNDIGEFRLYALQPGDYYVSATLRTVNPPDLDDDRSAYAPTYFPGTADVAAAQQITVGNGQTVADITIPLMPIRTARISGIAIDSRGQPLQGTILVSPRSSTDTAVVVLPSMTRPGQLHADGSFTIARLSPGDYTVQIQSANGNGAEVEYGSVDVSLNGTDLTGIRIVASGAPTLGGRVILPAAGVQSLRAAALRVGTTPVAPIGTIAVESPSNASVIAGDWSFQVRSRPGPMRLAVVGLQAPWTVKSIRYRGADITDTGLDVRGGEDLTDVEIELTNQITTVSGFVTNTRGEAIHDYRAIVFAKDRDKRRPPSRYVRTARADQDGRFSITMLPPGDYLAFAAEIFDSDEAADPAFLDRLESHAIPFSLSAGQSRGVDLTLSPIP